MEKSLDYKEVAAAQAAYLGSVEVSIGSALHALKIPFAGQVLSLHQIFSMLKNIQKYSSCNDIQHTPWMSGICVSLLKSLSPAGKRLTPMLAISMQGLLMSLPLMLLGINQLSLYLGALLSALWAYVQPVLITLIFLGPLSEQLILAFQGLTKPFTSEVTTVLISILAMLILTKLFLAALLVRASAKENSWFEKIFLRFEVQGRKLNTKPVKKMHRPLAGALKDTLNPLLIISIVMIASFLYLSQPATQKNYSYLFWVALRPLALAFITFYIFRRFEVFNLILSFLERRKLLRLAAVLDLTLKKFTSLNP